MAWPILYPDGYPIDGKIVPVNYGKPDSSPKVGLGIGGFYASPERTKQKRAKWKAQYEANRKARAALNSEMHGEAGSRHAATFHARLRGLSVGTG